MTLISNSMLSLVTESPHLCTWNCLSRELKNCDPKSVGSSQNDFPRLQRAECRPSCRSSVYRVRRRRQGQPSKEPRSPANPFHLRNCKLWAKGRLFLLCVEARSGSFWLNEEKSLCRNRSLVWEPAFWRVKISKIWWVTTLQNIILSSNFDQNWLCLEEVGHCYYCLLGFLSQGFTM